VTYLRLKRKPTKYQLKQSKQSSCATKKILPKNWLKYVADDILNLTFLIVVVVVGGVVIIGY